MRCLSNLIENIFNYKFNFLRAENLPGGQVQTGLSRPLLSCPYIFLLKLNFRELFLKKKVKK